MRPYTARPISPSRKLLRSSGRCAFVHSPQTRSAPHKFAPAHDDAASAPLFKLDNATNFAGVAASYNNLNQVSLFNGATFAYDANGNLTSDGSRSYTYDAADRLLTITAGSAVTTFGYDGLGRRVQQTTVNGTTTTTRYLWCGTAVCQTRDGTDTVTARLFWEGEYRPSGTKKYFYLTDHLGSVRDVVDITGTPTLVAAFDYTPYGAVARSWGSITPVRTYGKLLAGPNGLLMSATRAYSPAIGKWLNSDPIREIGSGPNLTSYVGANPVKYNDPLGLEQGLQAITVGGGEEGFASWLIRWELNEPSPNGGYIVQEVIGQYIVEKNGQTTVIPYHFWEAWQVLPGSKVPTTATNGANNGLCDDLFRNNPPDNSKGHDQVFAQARFYEGIELPASFVPHNPNTFAGSLPSTPINPNLPTEGATPPVKRKWEARW